MTYATITDIPPSANQEWGFFGTMENATPPAGAAAWPLAMIAVSNATSLPLEVVRIFLDSRHGRHFADEVRSLMHLEHTLPQAIENATKLWMHWTISTATSRSTGIPRGLPYLTGFVIHCEVTQEATA